MLSDAINLRLNISDLLEFTDKLPLLWDYIMAIIECVSASVCVCVKFRMHILHTYEYT